MVIVQMYIYNKLKIIKIKFIKFRIYFSKHISKTKKL